jgi:uncharacterized membrane protein
LRWMIGAAGIIVVSVGVLRMFAVFIALEFRRQKGERVLKERELERQVLGSYLLLGLEFLIAADIVETILKPTLEDLGLLAAVVVIRTVLSYFLTKEMKETGYGEKMQ